MHINCVLAMYNIHLHNYTLDWVYGGMRSAGLALKTHGTPLVPGSWRDVSIGMGEGGAAAVIVCPALTGPFNSGRQRSSGTV